ncbi:MAG: hypothetical protein QM736_22575 [Vicinamibacterales bacterium]
MSSIPFGDQTIEHRRCRHGRMRDRRLPRDIVLPEQDLAGHGERHVLRACILRRPGI